MHQVRRLTTLMVSHEAEWVRQYKDKVYLLKDGTSHLMA
jgi:energy-coupling factor transporter ATP-binding protein EcfA2